MNEAFIIENGSQLIEKLLEAGYEKTFDKHTNGFRTILFTACLVDHFHVVGLEIPDGMIPDEVSIRSFWKKDQVRMLDLLKEVEDTGRLPKEMRKSANHVYNTALIDGRLYECQNWF